jgi:hypothetical protein
MDKSISAFLVILLSAVMVTACQTFSLSHDPATPTHPATPPQVPATVPPPQQPSSSNINSNPIPVTPKKLQGAYPRLANYYHIPPFIGPQINMLAKWDLIVVNYNVLRNSPEALRRIRKENPNIKILAWISAGLSGNFRSTKDFNENWVLHYGDIPSNPKSLQERQVIMWTNKTGEQKVAGMNPSSEWATYLPNFVHDNLMSSGLFDGVFL